MFDKSKVLEKILADAPILSNLRKEIEVSENPYDKDSKKVKTFIYAYYFNRGVKDPELKYHRINNPIQTTKDSSLAEIYSVSYWDEKTKLWIKGLEENGKIKKGEVLHQGPWIKSCCDDSDILKKTREPDCPYEFFHSGYRFLSHFNETVKNFGYDLELIGDIENNNQFVAEGACAIKSTRMINYSIEGDIKERLIEVISPIPINLDNKDPSLSEILDEIEISYNRTETKSALDKGIIIV
jgi:hypothetical protein